MVGWSKLKGLNTKNNEQNSKTNKQEVPLPQINEIKLDSESWASQWEFWNVLISGQNAHFKEGRGEMKECKQGQESSKQIRKESGKEKKT